MSSLLLAFLLTVCAVGEKDRTFTGSTPAAPLVRTFLGISLGDSIDFIRWKLSLDEGRYRLSCRYGVGKPNTNGFVNGGEKIDLAGPYTKNENRYELTNGPNTLMLVDLNGDLLHLLNPDNTLLVGNGGWSFTLNSTRPSIRPDAGPLSARTALTDSIVFVGRTPCGIPGLATKGPNCYKLKWKLMLYADGRTALSGQYKVEGTAWRQQGGRMGTWEQTKSPNGNTVFRLNDENGNPFLFLLQPDENILFFTDAQGRLLVGDEDFSYTLNNGHGKK